MLENKQVYRNFFVTITRAMIFIKINLWFTWSFTGGAMWNSRAWSGLTLDMAQLKLSRVSSTWYLHQCIMLSLFFNLHFYPIPLHVTPLFVSWFGKTTTQQPSASKKNSFKDRQKFSHSNCKHLITTITAIDNDINNNNNKQ